MAGFDGSELKDEKGERAIAGAIDEPKDSERFISGGERSEETVRRLLGGVLYGGFAIVREVWGVCRGLWSGRDGILTSPPRQQRNDGSVWREQRLCMTVNCEWGSGGEPHGYMSALVRV